MRTSISSLMAACIAVPAMAWATPATPLQSAGIVVADGPAGSPRVAAMVGAARRWWTYLSTGDERLIRAAVDATFHDNTLPAGREQGREGAIAAFRGFREAAPDMRCVIERMLVVKDMVHARGQCSGTFTGPLQGTRGAGQPFSFAAVDTYRIRDGRIVEDWHLEDYLTFFRQIGLVPAPSATAPDASAAPAHQ